MIKIKWLKPQIKQKANGAILKTVQNVHKVNNVIKFNMLNAQKHKNVQIVASE